jgi:hypothetical protein
MALSRTIPIKNRIFTAETLETLLSELSRHYTIGSEYARNFYLLQIAEDEYTTTLLDKPPASFAPLLTTPIHYLSLRFDCSNPSRHVEFRLFHQADVKQNSVQLHSDDEDWVTITYAKIAKLLEGIERQSTVLQRFGFWLECSCAFVIGWPLKNLFFSWALRAGYATQLPNWTWKLLVQHMFLAGLFGALPTIILFAYAANAFPPIEIKTGPPQYWAAARRRSQLKIVIAAVILAPLGNFLYDLYKLAFS